MNFQTYRGALALPLLLAAMPAQADETGMTDPDIIATGLRPDAHGPAGTMADHVHKSGDLMLGMMWMHEEYGGRHRAGTRKLTDAEIAAAGYSVKDRSMTMDMAMLHVMWAPSDRVTLMLVPSWMRMDMTMQGLPMSGAGGMTGDHAHTLMPGETMAHSAEGFGDTQFGALVSLSRKPGLAAHAGLMVSAPTGSVRRRNANGSYVHYMMQGGSGTWDFNPSLTMHGLTEHFGWGAQASYLWRGEDKGRSGFRFGDRFTATTWLSKPLSERASLSARLTYTDEGTIKGHYDGAHSHSAPPDRQGNYGGQRLDASLGANLSLNERLRLGAEASLPLHQKVNGVQLPRQFGVNINASMMF